VTAIVFQQDGRRVFAATTEGAVVWDAEVKPVQGELKDLRFVAPVLSKFAWTQNVAVDAAGRVAVAATAGNHNELGAEAWEMATGKLLLGTPMHEGVVPEVAVSMKGNYVGVGWSDEDKTYIFSVSPDR